MRAITISREYGAGGGEVARRLADLLGWKLLDRELLHRAAQLEHLPDAELEAIDEQAVSLADRFRLHPPHQRYLHGLSEAARAAAEDGNVILVGRGTRQLVGEAPGAFHLRLVAPRDWRSRRMAAIEAIPLGPAEARRVLIDRGRDRFTRYFFGPEADRPWQYDLVVNTGRVPLDEVVDLMAALVRNGSTSDAIPATAGRRISTLGASWEPARPASRPRWRTGWAYDVMTGHCSNKRPSGSACLKSTRKRSTRTRRESSTAFAPAASIAATSRFWGSS